MMSRSQVIVLDDDPMMALMLEKSLGAKCVSLSSLSSLFQELPQIKDPQAFIVDIHLAHNDCGLQAIPQLRERYPFCPILVITADPNEKAVTEALACGADDFIQKPIHPQELLSRLHSRKETCSILEEKTTKKFGDLNLNTRHRRLYNSEKETYLSPSANEMLSTLIELRGSVVPRDILKRRTWGKINVSDNAVNRKIFEVRRAIKEISNQVRVENVYGGGFTLVEHEEN